MGRKRETGRGERGSLITENAKNVQKKQTQNHNKTRRMVHEEERDRKE